MAKLLPKAVTVAAALLGSIVSANAGVTFTSSAFDSAPALGQTMVVDFDNANALGYSLSTFNAQLHQGALVPGIAAPPVGDATQYLAVLTGGIATLNTPFLNSLSVYIGSIDAYNMITFRGLNGFTQSFGGVALNTPANGDQFDALTNRRFNFTFDPNDKIDQIDFTSSGNSFEFDNIAAGAAITLRDIPSKVPEPVTLTIFGAGLVGAALMRRRKMVKPV
jgi:PEP-CTERM motif